MKEEIIDKIRKYGLKPSTYRKLPLFSLSCIFSGYNRLEPLMEFSLTCLAAVGSKDNFNTLMNEELVAEETKKKVQNNPDLRLLLLQTMKMFEEVKEEYKKSLSIRYNNPKSFIKMLISFYPKYMTCIGVYNCFWRFLYKEENKSLLPSEILEQLARERTIVAELYPKIELDSKEAFFALGQEENLDGDLLRYFSLKELEIYLESGKITPEQTVELSKRRENYFYFCFQGEEQVLTDLNLIQKIKAEFFKVEATTIVSGSSAHPGIVRGIVHNYKYNQNPIKENSILVTNMTSPDQTVFLGKCVAIITDEGGILSHAAIIAREMGKPCIIGTKIATEVFKDGDFVEVNATEGIIKKLDYLN